MIRRPPRSTHCISSAASDVYKRQDYTHVDDYIDATRLTAFANTNNQFVVLKYANQSARLYGLDLSGRMPLARTGLGEFGLRGLMNYTKGENRLVELYWNIKYTCLLYTSPSPRDQA
eukprot:TRINITY_DN2546_c0_g1_i11.p2 TRINITY_DN2546_c0_g1~~TRINITY_DN2546_c0_g1_i11.p2  ORF type:complete len:117 (-),score=29.17 TRINITY_DN2546_c0_g1_i11:45-395(-)